MAGKSVGAVREQLQLLMGDGVPVTVENFINQAGTQFRNAVIAVRPKTVNDVQLILRTCQSLRIRVRAIGNTFSLAPLFPEENQLALYTNFLERHDGPKIELFRNSSDPTMSELTVMCNVTMQELVDYQIGNGVELPGNTIHRFSTVGGCVASMAHGSGLHVQTLSDLIVRMRIIDSSGSLRSYDFSDPELLDAAKGSLGLFGVIYDVTFRVSPLSVVQVDNRWISASHVFYDPNFLSSLLHNNVSCQLFWWPLNSLSGTQKLKALVNKSVQASQWYPEQDEIWVRTINRPAAAPEEIPEEGLVVGSYWHGWSFKKNKWFSKNLHSTSPISLQKHKNFAKGQFMGKVLQPVPLAIHFYGDIDENPVWQMEMVFNHDPDCSILQTAMAELIQLLQEACGQGSYPINLPVEIGVTGASNTYLAPSYAGNKDVGGSGYAAYIKLTSFVGTEGWREFCSQLAHRWLKIPGIRPSWGHQWSFIPEINNIISGNAQSAIAKFRSLHERAKCDPGRLFFSERLETIIYGAPSQVIAPQATEGAADPNTTVYITPNNQQVHGQVQAAANGQVRHVYIPTQGQTLVHDQQLLANPPEKKKKSKSKLSYFFKGKQEETHDGIFVRNGQIVGQQVPQVQSVTTQQPTQVYLVKNADGSVVKQQVIQQGASQNWIPQQGLSQQAIPKQQVLLVQAPGGVQNQMVNMVAGQVPQQTQQYIIRR